MQPQLIFVEYLSANGMPYYYNTLTKQTQWEHPPPTAAIVKPASQKIEPSQQAYFASPVIADKTHVGVVI